ncbi:MAG: 5-methylcytosine-specific restriction endonuclease system specificity protein McrC [Clostridiales bacterium]|jgi:5-methylcytosine-specific restriction enzyme subunit McrC|nr:5-methylcytosine-specific restriction endonuclease system specificity protein McrC [Clostridiales bacterium]
MLKDKRHIVIANIYYMLSYAYQNLQQKNYEEIETEEFENVRDLFAAILAKGMAAQLKQGLSKEYIERQDITSTLKGKIDLKEEIQLKMRNSHKLACCYDELSENNYMNQIIKTTALCLINANGVLRKNKDALKRSTLFFSEVDSLNISAINWKGLNYNRANSAYRMLMNICYLVLHELLLTTEKGKQKLAAFLDDQQMSRLYEKFILEYYKKSFPQYSPNSKEIKWNTTGATDFLPVMKSDIMLTNGKRKLIIDAKYYGKIMQSQYSAEKVRSNHLYQIFTYVKNEDKNNTGLVDGMLLYAKTDEKFFPNTVYDLSGNRISVRTLDLAQNFDGLKRQLDEIIGEWL